MFTNLSSGWESGIALNLRGRSLALHCVGRGRWTGVLEGGSGELEVGIAHMGSFKHQHLQTVTTETNFFYWE